MGSSMHISYRMTAAVWSKSRPRSHWNSQDLLSGVRSVQCMCQKGSEMCDWISLHNAAGPVGRTARAFYTPSAVQTEQLASTCMNRQGGPAAGPVAAW